MQHCYTVHLLRHKYFRLTLNLINDWKTFSQIHETQLGNLMPCPDLMVGKKSHSLHLVEDRIVACVDFVPSVDVPSYQKSIKPGTYQLPLVGGGMRPQHVALVQVVVVTLFSARMVFWDKQAVKVLLHCHHWAEVIMNREERCACSACVGTIKMLFYPFFNDPQRMMHLIVKLPAHHGQNFSSHVGHVVSGVGAAENFH